MFESGVRDSKETKKGHEWKENRAIGIFRELKNVVFKKREWSVITSKIDNLSKKCTKVACWFGKM